MSLSHQTTASRALCLSSCKLRTPAITNRLHKPASRSFWWGRHGYAQKYVGNLRFCKAQQFVSNRQSTRTKASPCTQIKKDPLYQYRVTQGWRLLSSWGKSGRSSPILRWGEAPDGKTYVLQNEDVGRENENLARYERLKRRVEEDPFAILFGGRVARSAWYPWDWSAKSCKSSHEIGSSRSVNDQSSERIVPDNVNVTSQGTTSGNQHGNSLSRSTGDLVAEEYVYDPISMRRVLKSRSQAGSPRQESSINQGPTVVQGQSTPNELSRSQEKASPSRNKRIPNKIESSLERHARKDAGPIELTAKLEVKKPQTAKEQEPENVDSLKANDIRAAFAKLKEDFAVREKGLQEQTERRRQSMQEAFEKRMEEIELQFARETFPGATLSDNSNGVPHIRRQPSSNMTPDAQRALEARVQEEEIYHARQEQERIDSYAAQIHKKTETDAKLASEIEAHKIAMETHETQRSPAEISRSGSYATLGEGDMSAQVLKYVTNGRWYKKQAPHALARERAILANREEQKAKDRELVREMRDIYENAYGTIDTKHRQGSTLETQQGEARQASDTKRSMPQSADDCSQRSAPLSNIPLEDAAVSKSSNGPWLNGGGGLHFNCAASATQPLSTSTTSHSKVQDYLELASRMETELWALIQMCARLNSPRCYEPTALKLLAKIADNGGKMQADLEALPLSNSDFWCPNLPQRLACPSLSLGNVSSNCKILGGRMESSDEYNIKKAATSGQRERAGRMKPIKPEKQVYKILALNFDTHGVTSATTTSSLYESSTPPKSAASILSHLSHPASFIKHIEALQDSQFELVAGSRSMLVYKQVDLEPISPDLNKPSLFNSPGVSRSTEGILSARSRSERTASATSDPSCAREPLGDGVKTQNFAPSGGSSIRITVNSPSGGTVKIPSISVSSSETTSNDVAAASDGSRAAEAAPSSHSIQSAKQSGTEAQNSSTIKQDHASREEEEGTLISDEMVQVNGKHPRDSPVNQRRKRRGFLKRFKRLALRSFLLGGLCYFAGCSSVWYQKRKEALERVERERGDSLTARRR